MFPFSGRLRVGDEVQDMCLMCSATVKALEFLCICELLDKPHFRKTCFLLDLTHDPLCQAFMRIDPATGQLGQALKVEHEKVGAPSHEGDDAFAQERIQKRAPVAAVNRHAREDGHPAAAHKTALDLVLLDEVLPLVLGRLRGHRLNEMAFVAEIRISATRLPENTELPHELHVEPRLFEELALHGVLDGLAGLDAAARHDSGVVGLVDGIEDEQLVGPGDRMLAGDVNDDSRADRQRCRLRFRRVGLLISDGRAGNPRVLTPAPQAAPQTAWPRIFALWARLAAW
jgi:hypothetical protein